MLRLPLCASLGVAIALLAQPAAAQTGDEDGCTASAPCSIDVIVDEAGIDSVSITTMTSGDWFYLYVSNLDERAHTVTFADVTVQVGDLEEGQSPPFQTGAPGTYKLRDQPTGDEAELEVLEGDVVEAEDGDATPTGGKGAPGPMLAGIAFALGLAMALRRP